MRRTQIQLEENVFEALRAQAFQEKCSLASLIRATLRQSFPHAEEKHIAHSVQSFSFMGKGKSAQKSVSKRHDKALWEEAQGAVSKLSALKPLLSPKDEETLAILIDKKLLSHLEKSMREAEEGELEPLKNILR